jgi:hypothetical protein
MIQGKTGPWNIHKFYLHKILDKLKKKKKKRQADRAKIICSFKFGGENYGNVSWVKTGLLVWEVTKMITNYTKWGVHLKVLSLRLFRN